MNRLLERFPKEQEFWAALRESYTVKVLFGIHVAAWNRGFELTAGSVKLIATTGALVDFDLYFYPTVYAALGIVRRRTCATPT